jgi:hypothetical protein
MWMLSKTLLTLCLIGCSAVTQADQKQRLGAFDVHYVVVPSMFFNEEIANRYEISRGRDRALINISVLDQSLTAVAVTLDGAMTNLLGQRQELEFREVREGSSIYYLAPIKHADRETLRFSIRIHFTGNSSSTEGTIEELNFQQQMFWDGR